MAAATATRHHHHHRLPKPKSSPTTATRLKVCFSYAAYAKKLIHHLKSLHIPILPGLTASEFSDLESEFGFSFPPDLRSILQEGVPFGPDFPNWRSSSSNILNLINLPGFNLSRNIRRRRFWVGSWGVRPGNWFELNSAVKKLIDGAPALVPIYTNCYIPASPASAGNPVFYVDEESVKILSFDIAGFFQQLEINPINSTAAVLMARRMKVVCALPAWAATAAREIDFWTDAAENGVVVVDDDSAADDELTECMEEVFWRLRDGGWREDEVREMMMMDGCDRSSDGDRTVVVEDEEEEVRHVRMLSAEELLRAGWSREDVVYSLGLEDCDQTAVEEERKKKSSPSSSWSAGATFDFQIPNGCGGGGDRRRRRSLGDYIGLHSVELEV